MTPRFIDSVRGGLPSGKLGLGLLLAGAIGLGGVGTAVAAQRSDPTERPAAVPSVAGSVRPVPSVSPSPSAVPTAAPVPVPWVPPVRERS